MGNLQSPAPPLKKNDLDMLSRSTHYDRKEIKQLHVQFVQEAPAGYIPKDDFKQLAEIMGIRDGRLSHLLFQTFDLDGDDRISFVEFIRAISVMTRGNANEKLKLMFDLYDLDQDGYVTREEMYHIVSALYEMMGDLVQLQGELQDPNLLVNRLFEDMDNDNDGKMNFAEFSSGVMRDLHMAQSMNLY